MPGGINFNPKTFRTLEFLLLVVSNIAGWLVVIASTLPDQWGIYITAASVALYALWRGLAQQNASTRDYWHTTEFWAAVLGSLPAVIGAFANTIDVKTYTIVQGLIVAASGIANGVRKQPDVAAGNVTAGEVKGETDLFVTDDLYDPAEDGDDLHSHGAAEATAADPLPGTNIAPADMGGVIGLKDDPTIPGVSPGLPTTPTTPTPDVGGDAPSDTDAETAAAEDDTDVMGDMTEDDLADDGGGDPPDEPPPPPQPRRPRR